MSRAAMSLAQPRSTAFAFARAARSAAREAGKGFTQSASPFAAEAFGARITGLAGRRCSRVSHGRNAQRGVRAEFDDSEKMYVPGDSFGGMSPEKKMSSFSLSFFTFAAVKIVLYQLEGVAPVSALPTETDLEDEDDVPSEGKMNTDRIRSDYDELYDFYTNVPLVDPDDWMRELLGRKKMLGMRILEVRKAYASMDFEWDSLQRLAIEGLEHSGAELMRECITAQFAAEPAERLEPGHGGAEGEGERN